VQNPREERAPETKKKPLEITAGTTEKGHPLKGRRPTTKRIKINLTVD